MIFFFIHVLKMVYCVYSIELPRLGDSNENTQYTFVLKKIEKIYLLCLLTLHEKFVLCISSNMYQIYENACICNYFHIFAFRLLKFDSCLPIINDQIYVGAHT